MENLLEPGGRPQLTISCGRGRPVGDTLAGMNSRQSSRPRVTISSPGDVVAVLPYYVGFHPVESVVVAGLVGPRHEIGPVLRYDADVPMTLAAPDVLAKLTHHGITAAYVAVYSDEADPQDVADVFDSHAATFGLIIVDVVGVRHGRWRSCRCHDPSCCPEDGTPVPDPVSSPVGGRVAAMAALKGRAVLPTRAALESSVAAPVALAARAGELRLEQAVSRVEADLATISFDDVHRRIVGIVDASARAFADGAASTDPDDAALVVIAVESSLRIRDDIATRPGVPLAGLIEYLCAVARLTPDPFAAAICSLVACAALRQGSGALANVAIERALRNDPSYSLACILDDMSAVMISPAQMQVWAASARAGLEP